MAGAAKIVMFGIPTCTYNANVSPLSHIYIDISTPGTWLQLHAPCSKLQINQFLSAREALWSLTLASGTLAPAGGTPKIDEKSMILRSW